MAHLQHQWRTITSASLGRRALIPSRLSCPKAVHHLVDLLTSSLPIEKHSALTIASSDPAFQTVDINTRVASNLLHLQQLSDHRIIASIIIDHPLILTQPLDRWLLFLTAYGLSEETLAKLLEDEPEVFLGCIYETGRTILLFKEHGYTDRDIQQRIFQYYPQLLKLRVDRDMQPVLQYLQQQGCDGQNLRQLLWEYPRIFSKDYRRKVRTFQHLGVYGLKLPSNRQ